MPKKHTLSSKVRKRRGKDMDEIHEDLRNGKEPRLEEPDVDLPGEGQFMCIQCTRHFVDEPTREAHKKTKYHKRMLKLLKEVPYSLKEAEAAGGVGTYDRNILLSTKTKKSLNKHPQFDSGISIEKT